MSDSSMDARTVLIVDDSKFICSHVAKMLGEHGFRVDTATTGNEALLKIAQSTPDFLIIDIGLPDMSGIDFLRELYVKDNPYEAIMITGQEKLENTKKAMELGAFGSIAKPVVWNSLEPMLLRAAEFVRIKKERFQKLELLHESIEKKTEELNETVNVLENQGRRFDTIVNSMEEGLLAVDNNTCIMMFNCQAEKIFGIRFGDCAGQTLLEAIPDQTIAENMLTQIQGNPLYSSTIMTILSMDLGKRHFQITMNTVFDEKQISIGSVFTFLDISDRIKSEQLRSSFLSLVAHELRTPLTIVTNDLMAISGSENREIVDEMRLSCGTLDHLVNNLLMFTKLSDASYVVKPGSLDIVQLVTAEAKKKRQHALRRGIHIEVENKLSSVELVSDGRLIAIILDALLDNAVKFNRQDGAVRIKLELSKQPLESYLRIAVIDQGCGIAENLVDRIFNAFTQGEDHLVRKFGGMGTGLFLAKRAAYLLSATLDITDNTADGCCFTLLLPAS